MVVVVVEGGVKRQFVYRSYYSDAARSKLAARR